MLEKKQVQTFLSKSELCTLISEESIQTIMSEYKIVDLKKDEALYLKDHSSSLLILFEGCAAVSQKIEDHDFYLGSIFDHSIINSEVIANTNFSLNKIKAVKDSKILCLNVKSIAKLEHTPQEYILFLKSIMKINSKAVCERESQIIINDENRFLTEKKNENRLFLLSLLSHF